MEIQKILTVVNQIKTVQASVIKEKLLAMVRTRSVQVSIVAAIVVAGCLIVWLLTPERSQLKKGREAIALEKTSAEYLLSPFFLPVPSAGGKERMVRIQVALQVAPSEAGEEIKKKLLQLRSLIVTRLVAQEVENLKSEEKRSLLKSEIRETLNQKLEGCKIRDVLVTELLIF